MDICHSSQQQCRPFYLKYAFQGRSSRQVRLLVLVQTVLQHMHVVLPANTAA